MKVLVIASIIYFTQMVMVAYADCIYDGQSYPTGSTVGPYVCQPDGSWK